MENFKIKTEKALISQQQALQTLTVEWHFHRKRQFRIIVNRIMIFILAYTAISLLILIAHPSTHKYWQLFPAIGIMGILYELGRAYSQHKKPRLSQNQKYCLDSTVVSLTHQAQNPNENE